MVNHDSCVQSAHLQLANWSKPCSASFHTRHFLLLKILTYSLPIVAVLGLAPAIVTFQRVATRMPSQGVPPTGKYGTMIGTRFSHTESGEF